MASITDVARYILLQNGSLTTMKLQKLVYYSQAQSLVKTGSPLFEADFYAWRAGPVAPELFRHHRGKFFITAEAIESSGEQLGVEERVLIDEVCAELGSLSGQELSERTHAEAPWVDARGDLEPAARGSEIIAKDAIAEYYREHPVIAA